MKNHSAIIIGGTGQFGIILSQLLVKKKYKVFVTTRFNKKIRKYRNKYKKINFVKLNIYKKKEIKKILNKINPQLVFYFAGQSSPQLSHKKKKETYQSNYLGCKNVLEEIKVKNSKIKFLNATSSEMYGHIKGKISLTTPKKPLNPYGKAKKKSFNLVKKYRENFKMENYNAILFNSESYLRDKSFLIAKICIAAINAYKFKKITTINNILVTREWNWCEEQCELLFKFLNKKPQDFILSNGKSFSIKQMLKFAFEYFNLNFSEFIKIKNKKLKKNEIKDKRSNFKESFKRNNINIKNKIYGKKLIHKMIKFYLNGK